MTAYAKANVHSSFVIAVVDGICASVPVSKAPASVFPVVCVSRLF